jgi:predicted flavoprotein YhiN
VEQVKNHQSVNWLAYFEGIKTQCPWSLAAYQKDLIDIVEWQPGVAIAGLGAYSARMYIMDHADNIVEAMAKELDTQDVECEWLFSYPGYGEYATPVAVLIQQNRKQLQELRSKQND